MTYASFLVLFLVVPLTGAVALAVVDLRRGRRPAVAEVSAVLVQVALAVIYTTPWDNYLVASRVWFYDPARVLGVTLGWVPLEEYLFFVLQTALAGLVTLWLLRAWPGAPALRARRLLHPAPLVALALPWLAAAWALAAGWRPGTYLALELVWALPPIAMQLAVGADVLWRRRGAVLAALLPVTLYLCAADALAIHTGVWTIAPGQSLNLFLGGVLPVEEAVFFLLTDTLVVLGLTLALAPETRASVLAFKLRLGRVRRPKATQLS